MLEYNGPVYLRLSRDNVGSLHNGDDTFKIGKGNILLEGNDITLAATGTVVELALKAATALKEKNINARVIELLTLKPFDNALILESAKKTGAIVTVEEHSVIGGLGSAVAEAIGEGYPIPVLRCGIMDRFGESGKYPEILGRAGISVERIIELTEKAVSMKR